MAKRITFRFDSEGFEALEQKIRSLGPAGDEIANRLRNASTQLQNTMQVAEAAVDRSRRQLVAANDGYRGFGTIVQQAGFQVGDFAVQVASGQNAMRAFVQQGSQVLGIFGPWGALAGAALAVTGALATTLLGLGDNTDKAKDAALDYNKAVELSNDLLLTAKERAQAAADEKLREAKASLDATLVIERENLARLERLKTRRAEAAFDAGMAGTPGVTLDTADVDAKIAEQERKLRDLEERRRRLDDPAQLGSTREAAAREAEKAEREAERRHQREVERVKRAIEEEAREREKAEEARQRVADRAAEEARREAEKRARDEQRRFERTVEEGTRVAADLLYDAFTGRISSIGELLRNTLLRATAQGLANAFVRPLVVEPVVGLAGGIGRALGLPIGLGGGAAAGGVGYGGGLGAASNLLSLGSSAYSLGSGGSLFGGIGAAIDAFGASALGIGSALPSAITSAGSIGVFTSEAALAGAASSGGLLSGVSLSTLLGGAGLALGGIMLAGSLFGNRRYGFFGPKPSVGPGQAGTLAFTDAARVYGLGSDNGGNVATARAYLDALGQAVASIVAAAGGTGLAGGGRSVSIGNNPRGFFVNFGAGDVRFGSQDEATAAALRHLLGAGIAGASGNAAAALAASLGLGAGPDQILADVQLGRAIDRLKLGEVERAVADINERYREQIERAKELGLAESELVKARDREISAVRAAELAPFAQAGASIKAFLEAQSLSPDSSLSPTGRLTEAQRQFGEYLGKVREGDLASVSPLLAAGQSLLAIGRQNFASTVDFANIESFVRSSLASVGQQVTSDAYIAAVQAQTKAQVDQFQQLKAELQKLRQDLALLGQKLAA